MNFKEKFEQVFELFEKNGIQYTSRECLACIEIAKQAMKNGQCTVEAYWDAKALLINRLECNTNWEN